MTNPDPGGGDGALRADKWLWQARFFKTRALAARVVSAGQVRVNGDRAAKPAQPLRPGDTLTFPQAGRIRVIRIRALGQRRGPAAEAAMLYDDLAPASPPPDAVPAPVPAGRPDRNARRAARAAKHSPLDPGGP